MIDLGLKTCMHNLIFRKESIRWAELQFKITELGHTQFMRELVHTDGDGGNETEFDGGHERRPNCDTIDEVVHAVAE